MKHIFLKIVENDVHVVAIKLLKPSKSKQWMACLVGFLENPFDLRRFT